MTFLLLALLLLSCVTNSTAFRFDFGFVESFIPVTWSGVAEVKQGSSTQSSVTPMPSWCVAKQTADDSTLQAALDYACGQTTADCRPIKYGGPCFLPNTVLNHSSYVFNSYYQINAKAAATCDFGGIAVVTTTDPSHGSCVFPSSGSLNQTTRIQQNDGRMLLPSMSMFVIAALVVLLV